MKTTNAAALSNRDAKKLTIALLCALLAYGAFLAASPFLLLRAAERRNDNGLNFLLACGARPISVMFYGDLGFHSPLLETAYNGHWNAVRRLVERGADVKCTDFQGASALHRAAFDGNAEIAELLVRNGANIEQKNGMRYAPLIEALQGPKWKTNEKTHETATRLEVVQLLLKAGADPNKASPKRGDALRIAKVNLPQAVPLLVAAGAKP